MKEGYCEVLGGEARRGYNRAVGEARPGARNAGTMALGILLVAIGLLFLLDSLGVIEGVGFAEFWPLLLIAVGVAIIYDRVRRAWRRR